MDGARVPEIRLAGRMARLGTESAFEVLARARGLEAEGRTIIHLEIGEPDFDTPEHIRDAAKAALDAGHTHYVPAPGIMPLREAVADFLERTGRLRTDPGRVIVTPGAKPIMFFTILAVCEEGDEVVLPDPGFPMYQSITAFSGARPVPVPLRERNGFRLDPPDASILDFDGMPERTVLLDGWSKTFAMTGWRLGFGVLPPALVEPVTRLVVNSVSCTSAHSQYAAIAALTGPWEPVERMVAELRGRREVIVDGLNRIPGLHCLRPEGAFYVFPSIADLGQPADEVERLLLRRAGVACLAGTAFGAGGEGFLRLSYANSVENIEAALDAIQATLAGP